MRDVNNGWAVRYTHANVASFFFIFVYAQIFYINYSTLNIDPILNKTTFLMKEIIDNFLNTIKPNRKPQYNVLNINTDKNNEFLQWFVGFSDAESAFMINIKNNREVHFVFQITLHIADIAVLYTIRENLGIGLVSIKGTTASFRVHSFQTIVDFIIPIFDRFPLLTLKQLDYIDWKEIIELKKQNAHYTEEGKETMLKLKLGMNRGRLLNSNSFSSSDKIQLIKSIDNN